MSDSLPLRARGREFSVIVKPYEQAAAQRDRRLRAGADAEKQMAFYLNRDFRDDEEVFVLNGVRIEDSGQPEQDGSAGVCQIDHLVVHRWGLFIVESKSVAGEVRVRSDGSGGDEWSRVNGRKEAGMASPIRQAMMQADFLRAFLQRNREQLLGRHSFGFRTIAKVATGSDQRGFKNAPIQLIVAISDKGRIKRVGGWKEPRDPFRVFVAKADLVGDKINQELKAHRKSEGSGYGMWDMEEGEPKKVAEFLAACHVDRIGAAPTQPKRAASRRDNRKPQSKPAAAKRSGEAACRHCGSTDLTAKWGKYGYYWQCGECQKNTTMPLVCSSCGAKGRDNGVRVRKDKTTYFRDCESCGASETIWTEE